MGCILREVEEMNSWPDHVIIVNHNFISQLVQSPITRNVHWYHNTDYPFTGHAFYRH